MTDSNNNKEKVPFSSPPPPPPSSSSVSQTDSRHPLHLLQGPNNSKPQSGTNRSLGIRHGGINRPTAGIKPIVARPSLSSLSSSTAAKRSIGVRLGSVDDPLAQFKKVQPRQQSSTALPPPALSSLLATIESETDNMKSFGLSQGRIHPKLDSLAPQSLNKKRSLDLAQGLDNPQTSSQLDNPLHPPLGSKKQHMENTLDLTTPSSTAPSTSGVEATKEPPLTAEQIKWLEKEGPRFIALVDAYEEARSGTADEDLGRCLPSSSVLNAYGLQEYHSLFKEMWTVARLKKEQVASHLEINNYRAASMEAGRHTGGRGGPGTKRVTLSRSDPLPIDYHHFLNDLFENMKEKLRAEHTTNEIKTMCVEEAKKQRPFLVKWTNEQLKAKLGSNPSKNREIPRDELDIIRGIVHKFKNTDEYGRHGPRNHTVYKYIHEDLAAAGKTTELFPNIDLLTFNRINEISKGIGKAKEAIKEAVKRSRKTVEDLLADVPVGYAATLRAHEHQSLDIDPEAVDLKQKKLPMIDDPTQRVQFRNGSYLATDSFCRTAPTWVKGVLITHAHSDHLRNTMQVGLIKQMKEKKLIVAMPAMLKAMVAEESLRGVLYLSNYKEQTCRDLNDSIPGSISGLQYYKDYCMEKIFKNKLFRGSLIHLIPALHCQADCLALILDKSLSNSPTVHIVSGDICAEPALLESVRQVLQRWAKEADLDFSTATAAIDATNASSKRSEFARTREQERQRIIKMVESVKPDLVAINSHFFSSQASLAASIAEAQRAGGRSSKIHVHQVHEQLYHFLAAQAKDDPSSVYHASRYTANEDEAGVAIMPFKSLNYREDRLATMVDYLEVYKGSNKKILLLQTSGWSRNRDASEEESEGCTVIESPTQYSDHSHISQVRAFSTMLVKEFGFNPTNIAYHGSGRDDELLRVFGLVSDDEGEEQ